MNEEMNMEFKFFEDRNFKEAELGHLLENWRVARFNFIELMDYVNIKLKY